MAGRVVRIERISPRDGTPEEPHHSKLGYQLGNPTFGSEKHHRKNAVYVQTLDEAAALVESGYSLRMSAAGKSPSLISPDGLRIIREADRN